NSSQAAVFADNAQTVGKRLTIFVALAGLLVLLTGAGGAGGAGRVWGAGGGRRRRRRLDCGRVGARGGHPRGRPRPGRRRGGRDLVAALPRRLRLRLRLSERRLGGHPRLRYRLRFSSPPPSP